MSKKIQQKYKAMCDKELEKQDKLMSDFKEFYKCRKTKRLTKEKTDKLVIGILKSRRLLNNERTERFPLISNNKYSQGFNYTYENDYVELKWTCASRYNDIVDGLYFLYRWPDTNKENVITEIRQLNNMVLPYLSIRILYTESNIEYDAGFFKIHKIDDVEGIYLIKDITKDV
jgi:hypothetical protein